MVSGGMKLKRYCVLVRIILVLDIFCWVFADQPRNTFFFVDLPRTKIKKDWFSRCSNSKSNSRFLNRDHWVPMCWMFHLANWETGSELPRLREKHASMVRWSLLRTVFCQKDRWLFDVLEKSDFAESNDSYHNKDMCAMFWMDTWRFYTIYHGPPSTNII